MNSRIFELRKSAGLTQEQFGIKMGISKNYVNLIENGKKNPGDRLISDICREFNVNEEWLRNGTGEMFILPDDETAALVSGLLEEPDNEFYNMILDVLHTYEQLSPESQEKLKNFCKQLITVIKAREK